MRGKIKEDKGFVESWTVRRKDIDRVKLKKGRKRWKKAEVKEMVES